jgi:hypothetical protein
MLSISLVAAQDDTPLSFIRYELENGLNVILVEDHSTPTELV